MEKRIKTPIDDITRKAINVGEEILISGIIYTARDAAHKKMVDAIESGQRTPMDLEGQVIYYVGPTPAKPGHAIGSCGPTSSYRMDKFSPKLMKKGLKVMIGKGERSNELVAEVKKQEAVYLMAIGGIGALLSKTVLESKVIAYDELGAEAVRRLVVKDFPAICAIDSRGHSIFK